MKIFSVLIPGSFEDAFLYMGYLLAFTEERSLRMYSMAAVAGHVAQYLDPAYEEVPSYFFERNDRWTRQLNRLLDAPASVESLLTNLARVPQPFVELPASNDFLAMESTLHIPDRILLDVNVYNGRVYVGTESHLYDFSLDWEQPSIVTPMRLRFDARTLSTVAGFGAVSASCEDSGLFTAIDDFGWLGVRHQGFIRVANDSRRAAFLEFNLVNYPQLEPPALLLASHRDLGRFSAASLEHEGAVITELGNAQTDLSDVVEAVGRTSRAGGAVEHMWNSGKYFFAKIGPDVFLVSGHAPLRGGRIIARRIGRVEGRIVGTGFIEKGTVIETDDAVYALLGGEAHQIYTGGAISVRTFSRSKWYRRIIAITTEAGVILTVVFDDQSLMR
jgi:hypothetical protein